MNRDELVANIEHEFQRLVATIDGLGDRATTLAVTAEGWTSRDVVAHLVHYTGQVAFALGAPVKPPTYVLSATGRPASAEWNAMAVAHHANRPFVDVLDEFRGLVEDVLARVRLRSDDQLAGPTGLAWSQSNVPWEFIAGDTFLHWRQHTEDIEGAARADQGR